MFVYNLIVCRKLDRKGKVDKITDNSSSLFLHLFINHGISNDNLNIYITKWGIDLHFYRETPFHSIFVLYTLMY